MIWKSFMCLVFAHEHFRESPTCFGDRSCVWYLPMIILGRISHILRVVLVFVFGWLVGDPTPFASERPVVSQSPGHPTSQSANQSVNHTNITIIQVSKFCQGPWRFNW